MGKVKKGIMTLFNYGKECLRNRKHLERTKSTQQKSEHKGTLDDKDRSRWEIQHLSLAERRAELDNKTIHSVDSDVDCRDLFCGDHGDREKYFLQWEELFSFVICARFSFSYIFSQLEVLNNFGPALTLTLSGILIICTCIPVLSTFIFLGNYSKRYFIRLWDCVPILKGLPFAIALYSLPMLVYNINFTAIAVVYFTLLIHKREIPWIACNFQGASPNCIPLHGPKEESTVQCCDEIVDYNCTYEENVRLVPKYSTLDYWLMIRNMQENNKSETIVFLTRKTFAMVIAYVMLFVFVVMGMKRYRRILRKIVFCGAITLIPVVLATVVYGDEVASPETGHKTSERFAMYKFWAAIIDHSITVELPMETVNFGSQSTITTIPTTAAILVYVTVEIIILLLTVWLCISYQQTQSHYKILDNKCMLLRGQLFLFVFIPDMISRFYIPFYLLLVYYFFLFVWSLTAVILKCTAIVDALAGQFPQLRAYRTAVTGALCGIMLAYNFLLGIRGSFEFNYLQLATNIPFIKYTISATVAIGLFIYTPERINADYQFTHGVRLSNYIVYGIKLFIAVAIALWVSMLLITHKSTVNLPVRAIVLAPIPLGALVIVIQYMHGHRNSVFEPSADWGPKSASDTLERSWFDPTHHIVRDSSELVCQHSCMHQNSKLGAEILFWQVKKREHEATGE